MRLSDKNETPAGLLQYSNFILNIFKVLNGEIDKKEYKSKHKFIQKRAKDLHLNPSLHL